MSSLPAYDHLKLVHEYALRSQGFTTVAGVDEVGRGSWAGPLVAAAVILPTDAHSLAALAGITDSKRLSPSQRERLAARILLLAPVGIGSVSHHVVDRVGVATANRRALLRAVQSLPVPADCLLIDHFALPESPLPQLSLTHGDSLSLSIGAASIVAKVVRDRWMERCSERFPQYGFARHKGYGTLEHRIALDAHGPCSLHRRSYAPVAACLSRE